MAYFASESAMAWQVQKLSSLSGGSRSCFGRSRPKAQARQRMWRSTSSRAC